MRLDAPTAAAPPVTLQPAPAEFLAAANLLDSVNRHLGDAKLAVESEIVFDPEVFGRSFDDAYVQASTAATLLESSQLPRSADFAEGIRQAVIGTIRMAKAGASDTVVDVPAVLELIARARNESLAVAQELRAATSVSN